MFAASLVSGASKVVKWKKKTETEKGRNEQKAKGAGEEINDRVWFGRQRRGR